ncbi:MAG: type II toxin-antitoxin system ParD family antitoxin [Bacteroidales bacterium]|jgi:antitoxin ParD1/3/4|nr:type II toxin-antitoxin system ParD family antitoxin [Bacteroidales bacterium]
MKTTTIALGPHLEAFVQESVATGRYNNVSEVIREGVRLLEEREKVLRELDMALAEGEASGFSSLSREELIRRMEDEEDTVLRKSAE